jgi:hypothetical protein
MLEAIAREKKPDPPLLKLKYQIQIPPIFVDGPLH